MPNGSYMMTITGKRFWPLDPQIEDVDIEDIAHSLAFQVRLERPCAEVL